MLKYLNKNSYGVLILLLILSIASYLLFKRVEGIKPLIKFPLKIPETTLNIDYPYGNDIYIGCCYEEFGMSLICTNIFIFLFFDNLTIKKVKIIISTGLIYFSYCMILLSFRQAIKNIWPIPRVCFRDICRANAEGFCAPYPLEPSKARKNFLLFGMNSFPSGHSARMVWNFSVFLIHSVLFLNPILENDFGKYSIIVLSIINIFAIIITIFICVTRVTYNFHRVIDVIIGALVGIVMSTLYFFTIRPYKKKYFSK